MRTPTELPLHHPESGGPLDDLELAAPGGNSADEAPALDLDRIIGTPASPAARPSPKHDDHRAERVTGRRTPASGELPLFGGGGDDAPLITAPRPARPPLAVRRTTPEIPRVRPRSTATPARPVEEELHFPSAASDEAVAHRPHAAANEAHVRRPSAAGTPAGVAPRLLAAVLDVVLLGSIDAAVVYLTLALAGLTWQEYEVLPLAPLIGFLAVLNGGYLITFIAASGQTIGKMLTGVRVVGDDGRRVDIAGAVLRALGCGVSLMTLGAAYLPFLFTRDRRAVQDRISGTQVVSAR